jgi:hypothetical protein
MDPIKAAQYLAQLIADFANTLPASARVPTKVWADQALGTIMAALPKPAAEPITPGEAQAGDDQGQ